MKIVIKHGRKRLAICPDCGYTINLDEKEKNNIE